MPETPARAERTRATAEAPLRSDARIPALDGIRGVAILLVMAFHFVGHSELLFANETTAGVDRAVRAVTGGGWLGVDLFFVLSGFLITGILWDAKTGGRYFRNFYARRVLRIFPLYYGFLFILFIAMPLALGARWQAPLVDQVWYWFYLPNPLPILLPDFEENTFGFATTHLWSLHVEEQFYLLFPAVVLLLGRRQLMLVCAVAIVAAFTIRLGIRAADITPEAAYRLMPARMDALAAGALIALAGRDPRDFARAVRWAPAIGAVAAVALAAVVIARGSLHPHDPLVQTVGFSAIAALGAVLVLATVRAAPDARLGAVLGRRPLTWLGHYSYGLYVLHLPLMLLVAWRIDAAGGLALRGGLQLPAVLAFSIAAGLISVAAAWAVWHAWERRFLQLKDRFPHGRLRPDAVEQASPARPPDDGREQFPGATGYIDVPRASEAREREP
jgi:peptidoglycan/LPS O-acetylase OafA/YrhL